MHTAIDENTGRSINTKQVIEDLQYLLNIDVFNEEELKTLKSIVDQVEL